jgi:hypothetical protein
LKASNDITTLLSDYTTSDNVHLVKGQHVQIVQRLNNELCIVQLLSGTNKDESGASSTPTTGSAHVPGQKQIIEVQIPLSIIKSRIKPANFDG